MSDNPLEELAFQCHGADIVEVPVLVAAFASHYVVMEGADFEEMLVSIAENMAEKNRELDYLRNLTGLTPVVEATAEESDL